MKFTDIFGNQISTEPVQTYRFSSISKPIPAMKKKTPQKTDHEILGMLVDAFISLQDLLDDFEKRIAKLEKKTKN